LRITLIDTQDLFWKIETKKNKNLYFLLQENENIIMSQGVRRCEHDAR